VIIIEHNLDVIVSADWIMNLGRKEAIGRRIVACGTPEKSHEAIVVIQAVPQIKLFEPVSIQ
jgi:excinuclease UvrABC ATPase subunit